MKIDWKKIKKEYIESNGEVILKDLADKHGVKIGTLRSRKSREDWDKEIEGNVATDNATQRKENKNVATQKRITKIVEEVVKDIDKETVEEVIEESNATLTKYDTNVKERLIEVEAWARDGLIDEQIAHNLGIAMSTFYEYKKKHPEFSESLKKGKEVVDILVENALLQKALGIKETVKKAIKLKEVIYDQGKRVKETERIELADEEVYIPPDTTAQIFWLKNRKFDTWRDKPKTDDKDVLDKLDKLIEGIGEEAKS